MLTAIGPTGADTACKTTTFLDMVPPHRRCPFDERLRMVLANVLGAPV